MGSKYSTAIAATITNEGQLLAHIAAALAITRDAATQRAALQIVVSTRGAPPGTHLEAESKLRTARMVIAQSNHDPKAPNEGEYAM